MIYRFFFSSRRRHTRSLRDWSSDVCSSDLGPGPGAEHGLQPLAQLGPAFAVRLRGQVVRAEPELVEQLAVEPGLERADGHVLAVRGFVDAVVRCAAISRLAPRPP